MTRSPDRGATPLRRRFLRGLGAAEVAALLAPLAPARLTRNPRRRRASARASPAV